MLFQMLLETLVSNRDNIEECEIINLEQRLDRIKELIIDYDACQEEILQQQAMLEECFKQRAEFEANFYQAAKAQKLDLRPDTDVNESIRAKSETSRSSS